jgi:hypothetical protein
MNMKTFERFSKQPLWLFVFLLTALSAGCADKNGAAIAPLIAPPAVTLTDPARSATDVPLNRSLVATFNEALAPASVNTTTFALRAFGSATVIPATVTLDVASNTATLDPTLDLLPNTAYTATITTGVSSLATGLALAEDYHWSFQTALTADLVAPVVVATGIYGDSGDITGATAVPVNRAITVTFSEALDPATIATPAVSFRVRETVSSVQVAGTVTFMGATATFTPAAPLSNNLGYTAIVTTAVRDLAGNAMAANYSWNWTTTTVADTTAPTVTVTNPVDLATLVGVNRAIAVTFSEEMKQSTMVTTHVQLTETLGGLAVAGTVAYDVQNDVAMLTPLVALKANTDYTVTVTSGATDLAGNAVLVPAAGGLPVPNPWTFRTRPDPLTVTLTAPLRFATGVPLNRNLVATFSEAIAPLTATITSFTLREFGSAAVMAGSVVVDPVSNTVTFDPAALLKPDTAYGVTISTAVTSLASGATLAQNYTWSFETAQTADTTAPMVIATGAYGNSGDTSGATNLPINRASTATFNESMDSLTLASPATTFTVEETLGGAPVIGEVSYIGTTATFTPDNLLALNTQYTSTITTSAADLAGNTLAADYVWTWTTSALADTLPPTITVTNPDDLETGVDVNKTINATFSEEMKQASMITTNFTLEETLSGVPVAGTVSYDVQNNIASFTPENLLLPDTDYTMTVSGNAKDVAGNALVVPALAGIPTPNPWTFRTAAVPVPPPPLAINLRGVATFGIASRAGVTSTGITVVNGDVAIFPTVTCTDSTGNAGASQTCLVHTYSSPTGMSVNGSIFWAGDPFDNGGTANAVTNDLNIAWTEGMNKVDTMGAIAGDDMDGKVFTPGVYHNAALALAAGGTATIDAQNDPNAVFVFKVDSSFVDSGTLLQPTEIVLANGAQAKNIWFVTGLDITIGSGTTWFGNILAGRSATVLDGSTVVGRVLAGASGAGAIVLTGAASPSVTTITVPE